MRFVQMTRYGGPEVLELAQGPVPEPERTEVLIRVVSAGVNPVDWYLRAGVPTDAPLAAPMRFGWELAGIIERIGPGVTLWGVGDRVMGLIRYPHVAGAYAEYVVAPARQLARVPNGFVLRDAGGVSFCGLTAWQAIHDVAQLQPGERILINAANGGVGHMAVQIARTLGAQVTAVARRDVHSFVGTLHPDHLLDPTDDLPGGGFEVVVDLLGGDRQADLVAALRPEGRLIALADDPDSNTFSLATARSVRVSAPIVEPDREGMAALARMLDAGQLVPHIGLAVGLDDVSRAHLLGESRSIRNGKIVLTME